MARKQWLARLSMVILFGFTGSLYLVQEAIAPQIVQAYTQRINISLIRQPNESYDTISRRAESVARAAVQRSFDSDILVTDALITITAENNGLMAPILSVTVSRSQWQQHPDIQRWARYYPNTRSLLDFDGVAVANVERERAEAAKPRIVLNRIVVERDFNSRLYYVQGSITNQTGNIVRGVTINYVVNAGIRGDAGTAIVQPSTIAPGQVGLFKDLVDIDRSGIARVTSIEWINDDSSSGIWRPTN